MSHLEWVIEVVHNKFVCVFLGGSLLAYSPHRDIQCHVLDAATYFSHVKHTCKIISYLSKCDFSTDYNGNYNKDTKPLWCEFIP